MLITQRAPKNLWEQNLSIIVVEKYFLSSAQYNNDM